MGADDSGAELLGWPPVAKREAGGGRARVPETAAHAPHSLPEDLMASFPVYGDAQVSPG